jgi:hypothetical protein
MENVDTRDEDFALNDQTGRWRLSRTEEDTKHNTEESVEEM